MKIEQGLFSDDFTDYHAILGVSIDADAKQIRKRYLKIARKLHPDSLAGATNTEKQQASELLSKMVNPAYEKLTQEKEMAEYKVVLRMRGQQLGHPPATANLNIQTEAAKALLGSSNALNLYNSDLKKLAEQQYESLDQVLEITGKISELNLAYLMSSAGSPAAAAKSTSAPATSSAPSVTIASSPDAATLPPTSPKQHRESIIGSYLNRAREFEQKKDYSRAILEMREAVKAHPNSAPCHSKLASLYLQAGQPTMARIHLKRALDIDPNNALAKQLEPKINKVSQGKGSSKSPQSKSRGGLFGLFGGKQK
ncbi:MAG: DnaJ domain-containing protein [Leptolyngbya sp. SIO1D8]|nr:DnaJ domain-containing protein [Leptolyngbya sp. SIO1D8]